MSDTSGESGESDHYSPIAWDLPLKPIFPYTKHNNWEPIYVHTAKCDGCSKNNPTVMHRCGVCNKQFCKTCIPRCVGDNMHDEPKGLDWTARPLSSTPGAIAQRKRTEMKQKKRDAAKEAVTPKFKNPTKISKFEKDKIRLKSGSSKRKAVAARPSREDGRVEDDEDCIIINDSPTPAGRGQHPGRLDQSHQALRSQEYSAARRDRVFRVEGHSDRGEHGPTNMWFHTFGTPSPQAEDHMTDLPQNTEYDMLTDGQRYVLFSDPVEAEFGSRVSGTRQTMPPVQYQPAQNVSPSRLQGPPRNYAGPPLFSQAQRGNGPPGRDRFSQPQDSHPSSFQQSGRGMAGNSSRDHHESSGVAPAARMSSREQQQGATRQTSGARHNYPPTQQTDRMPALSQGQNIDPQRSEVRAGRSEGQFTRNVPSQHDELSGMEFVPRRRTTNIRPRGDNATQSHQLRGGMSYDRSRAPSPEARHSSPQASTDRIMKNTQQDAQLGRQSSGTTSRTPQAGGNTHTSGSANASGNTYASVNSNNVQETNAQKLARHRATLARLAVSDPRIQALLDRNDEAEIQVVGAMADAYSAANN